MTIIKNMIVIIGFAIITGCAHQITINPDTSMISNEPKSELIPAKIGYYFPQSAREKEVVTPGGGGDRVRYNPYRDIEPALVKTLRNVFRDVSSLNSANELELKKNSVDYVIYLEMTTNSSSPGTFTWPPTWFSVNLSTQLSDLKNNKIKNISVTGEGTAEYTSLVGADKGLSAKRASFEALTKLQKALKVTIQQKDVSMNENSYKKETEDHSSVNDVNSKLRKLNGLYQQGLISEKELTDQRSKILDSL